MGAGANRDRDALRRRESGTVVLILTVILL